MILDKQTELSNAQAITTGSILSTNTLDLGPVSWAGNSVGDHGDPHSEVVFNVDTTFVGGTSVEAQLVSADDAALSSNLVVHASSGAILTAALVAGQIFPYKPILPIDAKRYFGVRYVVVGTFSAGNISARMTSDRQTNR
jgi:hypothetical protein